MTPPYPDKIEITEEMIAAGADVLMADPFLGLGPTSAEDLAEKVLVRALSARLCKNSADDPEAHRPPLDGLSGH